LTTGLQALLVQRPAAGTVAKTQVRLAVSPLAHRSGVPSSALQFYLLVLKRSARNAIYAVKDKKPRLKA
jgi:hypothetical protein